MKTNENYKLMAEAGYITLLNFWKENPDKLVSQRGFWHAANSLETMVDYMAATGTLDTYNIISKSLSLYQEYTPNPPTYMDDQGWWGLAFMKAYMKAPVDADERNKLLVEAQGIWNEMNADWDTKYCNGGCWWNREQQQYKNAITNELFFTLSTRIYLATKDNKYLSRAEDAIKWFIGSGMITKSGLVIDGLNQKNEYPKCGTNLHRDTWTYNQGVILGGLLDLHRLGTSANLTLDFDPMVIARKIADAAVNTLIFKDGVLREVECETDIGNSCDCDQGQFKGIFMRYLGELDQASSGSPYRNFINTNAQAVWKNRKVSNNAFGQVWNRPFELSNGCYPSPSNILSVTLQSSGLDALVTAIT